MRDSQISGTWTRSDRQLHINYNCCPMQLGFSAPGPPGFDRYGQHYSSFLYQQTMRDPFPNLVASSSGSLYVAAGSGHSSQSKAHTRLFERDSRLPIQTQSANIDRVESSFRDPQTDFPVLGNFNGGHVCHSPQYPLLQFMSLIREPLALVVDALSQDW